MEPVVKLSNPPVSFPSFFLQAFPHLLFFSSPYLSYRNKPEFFLLERHGLSSSNGLVWALFPSRLFFSDILFALYLHVGFSVSVFEIVPIFL